jgi:hypothetical protein
MEGYDGRFSAWDSLKHQDYPAPWTFQPPASTNSHDSSSATMKIKLQANCHGRFANRIIRIIIQIRKMYIIYPKIDLSTSPFVARAFLMHISSVNYTRLVGS